MSSSLLEIYYKKESPIVEMSSVISATSGQPTGSQDFATRFVDITTSTYYDSNVNDFVLIPFSYNSGVLDINIQDNVYTDLITLGPLPIAFYSRLVRKMGGTGYVQSIGPNFTTYLQNMLSANFVPITGSADITGIQVYIPATVTKVQQTAKLPFSDNSDPFDISGPLSEFNSYYQGDVPPASDGYLYSGTPADNWGTAWVFQTPLTIKYFADGLPKYITFTTTFTKNILFNLP
jgi:hypothetical protein